MQLIERLQAQLRASARATLDAVALPPFTCFWNPDDREPGYNYAIPDEPLADDPGQLLDELAAFYRTRSRAPRFEFLEAYAPALSEILAGRGYRLEMRSYLMTCTSEEHRPPAPLPGVEVRQLTPAASLAEFQGLMTVQARSFGAADAPAASESDAERFRRRFAPSTFVVAQLDGEIVSGGAFTPPADGVTEVVGIATLPAFRNRGIAGLVTSQLAAVAFSQGIELAFLTAGDEKAGSVYRRVGFQPAGYGCAWILQG